MNDAEFLWALTVGVLSLSFTAAVMKQGSVSALPEPEPLEWDGVVRRRRDAKRFNEHAKLFSAFLNNLGIAIIVAAILGPAFQGDEPIRGSRTFMALVLAGLLHTFGQLSLRLWKSEE